MGDAAGRVDVEIAGAAIRAAVRALGRGRAPAEPSHRAGSSGDGRGHGSVGHFLVLSCRGPRIGVLGRGRLALDTPKRGAERLIIARAAREGAGWAPMGAGSAGTSDDAS